MKHLTRCLSVLLTALLAAGCASRPAPDLADFTLPFYRQAYPSGSETPGA